MRVQVNGEWRDVTDAVSVRDFIVSELAHPEPVGVAVAVNGSVVPQSQWAGHRLAPEDEVELVGVMQGG